jgi:predicted phage terminase large subunit-like protein
VRCTTNPDADSWVAEFISWWIGDDGLPIPERCGLVRYFARVSDALVWGDSAEEVAALAGVEPSECKSLTFISAKLTDNAALMAADPGYMANLKALSRVERERLLGGNWKIRPAAGLYFPRHDATVLDEVPDDVVAWARGWDLAATVVSEATPDPDWTAGVLIGKRRNGRFVVADVARVRRRADEVRELVRRTAGHDGQKTRIAIPQDPGQAGKDQVQNYITHLTGYAVTRRRPSQDKVLRAEPFAAQWQAGKVDVVRGAWNDAFFSEFEAFPDVKHDDQVDAASDAFALLSSAHVGALTFASSDL